jgi:alkylation response protein AidB-like acyl-CoA dehydrogenase
MFLKTLSMDMPSTSAACSMIRMLAWCSSSQSTSDTCRPAFEIASDFAQTYVQGGRILIKHQAVAMRLADMATKISAVRALQNEAATAVDENAADAEALCNMAKMFASEEIFKVCQHAVELHGGNGIMLDFGIEKLFRDASVFLHMDATVDISKFKIVKNMFPLTAGKYAGPEA